MAEKATLLQDLPPVAKESSSSQASSSVKQAQATGVEVQSGPGSTITPFQLVNYGTFVLSFVLAGFAAVILYRKAISKAEQRYTGIAKVLAGVLGLVSLHGFVATFLYTNYLRNSTDTAPLSMTILIWVIFGSLIGYISNRIIQKNAKLKSSDAIIDAVFYAIVFGLVTLAVSDQIGASLALILSLVALITCTVPLSRFLISFKRVRFKSQNTDGNLRRLYLNSLVLLPASLPFFAMLYVGGLLGPDLTLFLFNGISAATIVFAGLSMSAGMKIPQEQAVNEAAAAPAQQAAPAQATTAAAASNTQATPPPQAAPSAPATPARTAQPSQPSMDPLVQELLAEQEKADQESAAAENAAPQADHREVVPPGKPVRPHLDQDQQSSSSHQANDGAPKKPRLPKKPSKPAAPNLKVKPPSKPQKRP